VAESGEITVAKVRIAARNLRFCMGK